MYRVLIADTEIENVKNFRNYIANADLGFSVAKALTQYREDLGRIIRNNGIQLIIADVRFFGANSYAEIIELNRIFPEMRFILYGGLNDIDYLKRSLEYGTVDYMIKPVKPSDLLRSLNAAAKYFEYILNRQREAEKLLAGYKDNFNVFELQFLLNLINGILTDDGEIYRSFRYFGLEFDKGYAVLQMNISNFKEIIRKMGDEEKHLLIYGVQNTITRTLGGIRHKSFIHSFNCVTVVVSGIEEMEKLYGYGERIKNNIYNNNNMEVNIGIGRIYKKPSEIFISYNEAVSALRHKYYMGYSTVIPIGFVEPDNHITARYPIHKENRLVYAAVTGEFDYCKALLDEIFAALRKSSPLPDMLLSQIVVDILISIGRYVKEQNCLKEVNLPSFFPINEAMKLQNIDDGYTYLYNALKNFCAYVCQQRQRADIALVQSAQEYLNTRYYETISLNKAALRIQTTPEYLNRLFIEHEGKTYFEYAIRLRLEKAKKFLAETDFDDDMIAVNIGYDDGKYFNGIFKQYENMSTDEYRAKVNAK